jgi:uncharacterized protein YecT (DUF1311 family)
MRRALMSAAFTLMPGGAPAGLETSPGALDACLASLERIEDAVDCEAVFMELCVAETIAMGEAAPDVVCLAAETRTWETKLAASLGVATARAAGTPGAAEALAQGQAAWEAYRDAECALASALAAAEGLPPQATAGCRAREAMPRDVCVEVVAQGGF